MVAICLLGALVYETHNAPGRYVYTGLEYFTDVEFSEIYLDTATGIQVREPGDILEYRPDEDEESR